MTRIFYVLLAIIAVLGAIAGLVTLRLASLNQFAQVEDAFAGRCAPVRGVVGPEDLQIDARARRAFISSFDRRGADRRAQDRSAVDEPARGAILSVSIDDPLQANGWRDRTGGAPAAFRPLGLHFYEKDEIRRLFVVNAAANSVEIYDAARNGELTHLETVTDRRLNSPNDVVAIGPRAFYVTNSVRPGFQTMLGAALKDWSLFWNEASGDVLYFNGVAWRLAAHGLHYANGVSVNEAGDQLYVAETYAGQVRVFERNVHNGVLTAKAAIKLEAAPENINLDEDGALWVGALPKPFAAFAFARNAAKRAPSQVFRLDAPLRADGSVETVYSNQGTGISASSVAARLGDKLLIGATHESKYLLCHLP